MYSEMYTFTQHLKPEKRYSFQSMLTKLKVFKKGKVPPEEYLRIVFTSFLKDTYPKCCFFLFKPSKHWEADWELGIGNPKSRRTLQVTGENVVLFWFTNENEH